jgi:glycosyltransferase involved in cell wall biosynthesis
MLAPWALQQGRLAKRIAWHVAQRRWLADAAFVHATSDEELSEVRRSGCNAPVAVVANGVELEEFPLERIERLREGGRTREVVFVSRIHPKKGIDILLEAWRIVSLRYPDTTLTLAGPGEPEHVDALRRRLAEDGIERVSYVGAVEGAERLALLARPVAVVLPSRSENYGMVVAEAMASGTAVITTTAVPWPELESRRCGWRVEVDVAPLAGALDQALGLGDSELNEMGMRGRAVIQESHTTDGAAARMEAAYEWACGRRSIPDFVEIVP